MTNLHLHWRFPGGLEDSLAYFDALREARNA